MSAGLKRVWLFLAILVPLLLFSGKSFAQLTIGNVDSGPYAPGSTIAATFAIDPATCIAQNNIFRLYLSDATGSFTPTQTLIGTYTGFYSSYVNGLLPAGLAPGTYRVRVGLSNGTTFSNESAPFTVMAGTAVTATLTSSLLNPANNETFGTCTTRANNAIFLTNTSSAGSTVTATVTNELDAAAPVSINFTTPNQLFTAALAHYTVFAKAVGPDGTIATRAYLIINNDTYTAFATSGNNVVCLPLGSLEYIVDVSLLRRNFPGNRYNINWGDQTTSAYTLCEIQQNGGRVSHFYTESSCGLRAGNINNAYTVIINGSNAFCGSVGTPVSTSAKVVVQPINRFVPPADNQACTNRRVVFVNTSVLGENPNNNQAECTPNEITYNWYVDGVPVQVNMPHSYNFEYTFTTHGVHTVMLTSTSQGACSAIPFSVDICVQDPPRPAFTLPQTVGCGPFIVRPSSNSSVVDVICNNNANYTWLISPMAGVTFVNGTTISSPNPEIQFANPGEYSIALSIGTTNCGGVSTNPQRIIVNNARTVDLSSNITLCNLSTYAFSATTSGPTRTTYTGTEDVLDDVFLWTVTGGAYSFEGGTTSASKYPSIRFTDYATYTITAQVTNVCGITSDTQEITFIPAPTVNAGPNVPICYNATAQLNGAINGSVLTNLWVGGAGTFAPNRNALNAVYTPTNAERQAGQVNLTLRATTNLGNPCNTIEDEVTVIIYPQNNITSAASREVCSGVALNYTPASGVAGSVYNWTAANADGRAANFTISGSGTIPDAITNSSNNFTAVVVYTITATANGCTGPPSTFTVTVNPTPLITATPANAIICSGTGSAIALGSSVAATRYTWTSVATPGISGNTNQSTPAAVSAINNTLINIGTTQGTVTYTITPVTSGCAGLPVQVVISIDPLVTAAAAGTDQTLCSATSTQLQGNTAVVGTGLWSLTSGQTGITFSDATQPNTTVNGLVAGQTYTFRWTITGTGLCGPNSDLVQITNNLTTISGTTSGSANVCSGSNSGTITLSGHRGAILRWERSIDGGNVWMPVTNTTTTQSFTNLTQTTQYRAVVRNANCSQETSTVATVTVNGGGTTATAGSTQILCNATSATLDGNIPATGETGTWSRVGASTAVITDPNDPKTTVTGLNPGTVYTFRWTITSGSPCGPTNATVTINSLAPLTNTISSTFNTTCSGQVITITGSAPTGGNGSYTYLWETSTDGISWSAIPLQTSRNLTHTINGTLSFRRTVTSSNCVLQSNVVTIIGEPPLSNNTISASANVCSGQTPNVLSGSLPTGGDGNYIYQWQSSSNGTVWTNITGENSQNYAPPVLSATRSYRRIVSTLSCNGPFQSVSNTVVLTLLNNARSEYNYTSDRSCAPFAITAANITAVPYPDRNSTYTWFANATQIGTGTTFPGYRIDNPGETVTIRLVVASSLGCTSATYMHDFSTSAGFTTNFTQDQTQGCGPLRVHFTNTSSSLTGVTFRWDFGNGITSNLPNPPDVMFMPNPTGDDANYTITLTTTTSCGDQVVTSNVLIRSAPVGAFSPNKTTGCSPLAVTFSNTTRGDNVTYTYDFGDGSPLHTTNSPANVMHTYVVTEVTDFTVTMTATNSCGTDVDTYIIRVTPSDIRPELVVQGNQMTGCAPFTVSFRNNTSGAKAFVYDFGDGSTIQTITSPETVQHTFTRAGTFTVTLYANSDCSQATTTETIVVREQPTVAFSAERTSGCPGLAVQFRNTSTNAISYLWDFGDGTTSIESEPLHVYASAGSSYTVTLTAINSLGCPNVLTKTNFINIVVLPVVTFNVLPGNEISVPNYRFTFADVSTGNPVSWRWDFGDGTTSNLQNPIHTYNKSGNFTVRLTIRNQQGCEVTNFQVVTIRDVPGALNMPNSFMPGSQNNEIRQFKAKGTGIESYKFTVFNKWGQVLWETTQIENGAPVEGWDGTYKGLPQPQGTYFWKAEVKFINGSEWKGMTYNSASPKKTGEIYLIR